MADVTVVGTDINSAGNGADVDLTLPVGIAEDDEVLLLVTHLDLTSHSVGTSGYGSPIASYNTGGAVAALFAYKKRMGAVPDTTIHIDGSGNSFQGTVCGFAVLRNVDASTFLDVAVTVVPIGVDPVNPGAAGPTTVNGVLAIAVVGANNSEASTKIATAPPSGYSNFESRGQAETYDAGLWFASKLIASAGTTENPGTFTAVAGTKNECAFTILVRAVSAVLRPAAPSASIVGGAGIVQFNSGAFEPHPDDPTDTHQASKFQLSATTDFSGSLEVDEELGSPNLLDYQATGIAAGTWYGRLSHVGEVSDGDWSETIEVVVTDADAGDEPSLSLVDSDDDAIEVEISVFSHPDGAVEPPDAEAGDVFHVSSTFQYRLTSGSWASFTSVEVAYAGNVDSRRVRVEGLLAGTSYTWRGLQTDNFGAQTPFSDDLVVVTDATPAEAPLQPTFDLDCGRDTVVSGSPYAHSDVGAGTNHAKTQARITYLTVSSTQTFDAPVTEVTWPDLPPGVATFALRYGDDSNPTRWGPYSASDFCTIPAYPSMVKFTAPTTLRVTNNVTVSWDFVDTSVAWLSNVERAYGSGAFVPVASNQAGQSTPFSILGKVAGTYWHRVQAVNPDTGELGEWAVIPITLVRADSPVRVFHRNAAQLAVNGGGGRQIWDSNADWSGTIEDEVAKGLLATRTGNGSDIIRSGWVFDGAGQPNSGDVIVGVAHRSNECEWPPWRFSNPQVTKGGPMGLADGTAAGSRWGHATLLETPSQPWWLASGMPCATSVYTNGAGGQTAIQSAKHTGTSFRYGRSGSLAKMRTVTQRNGQGVPDQGSATLGSSTSPRLGGPFVSHDDTDFEVFVHKEFRPAMSGGNAGWNIRSRFLGPGVADTWTDPVFHRQTDSGGDTIECGACGFAFEDMEEIGVGRSLGILFTSITIVGLDYATCEEPEEECFSGYTLNRILSIERHPGYSLVEYMTLGSVPCPEEE